MFLDIEKNKKKGWSLDNKIRFFLETTQRFLTASCSLKITCVNFRPKKERRKKTLTIWSKGRLSSPRH